MLQSRIVALADDVGCSPCAIEILQLITDFTPAFLTMSAEETEGAGGGLRGGDGGLVNLQNVFGLGVSLRWVSPSYVLDELVC